MENKKMKIAITHGDTNGVGYETIFKVFSDPEMFDVCTPVVYGSPKVAAYHSKVLSSNDNFTIINKIDDARDGRLNVLACIEEEVKVELGTPTEESSAAAMKALDCAMTDFRHRLFTALVSAPVDRGHLKTNGMPFNDFAHYVKTCAGDDISTLTIYANDFVKVASLTDDCSLKDVPQAVTKETVVAKLTQLHNVLKRDYMLSAPRIAVLSLNPDANGSEEKEMIAPAVTELRKGGMCVFGPYPADKLFVSDRSESFDAVLAMYHDQGVVPFRMAHSDDSYCAIAGLPLACTYPDTTPQFEIAGKGMADESRLRRAIFAAIDIMRNRAFYDEPLENPLPKLYKERRDEGDRQRFSGNMKVREQQNSVES